MTIILSDVDNLKEVVEEAKNEWLYELLFQLGVSENSLMNNDGLFSSARDEMEMMGVEVITDNHLGKTDVYVETELIAEWFAPDIQRIIDDNGKHFYRITLKEWSPLEDD